MHQFLRSIGLALAVPLPASTNRPDRNRGAPIQALLAAPSTGVNVALRHLVGGGQGPEWIPKVAAQGWLIITRDTNISVTRAEIEAIRDDGAAAVGSSRSSPE